jgi:hypothetical protein
MAENIPEYLIRMVRRPLPAKAAIPGTTPVLAFGDSRRAEIATLGINPSFHEFRSKDGSLLGGPKRRLPTLESLRAESTAALTIDQIQIVVAECAAYFLRNPYRRWFDPLDQLLRLGLGASYYDGTACHLDLVQWATVPAWGELPPAVKHSLLEEGLPHLRNQLQFGNLRLVLLNGREVLDHVTRIGLARLEAHETLNVSAQLSCLLYWGHGEGVQFVGWSTNLQSSRGVSRDFRDRLAQWLAGAAELSKAPRPRDQLMPRIEDALDARGYVVRGTVLKTKAELLRLLKTWLDTSDALSIGNAKRGQTPWIFIALDRQRRAVMNSDTKRAAVEEYVTEAQARGADLPWQVRPNTRNGHWNKLVFRADCEPTPGWYCYLQPAIIGPEEL